MASLGYALDGCQIRIVLWPPRVMVIIKTALLLWWAIMVHVSSCKFILLLHPSLSSAHPRQNIYNIRAQRSLLLPPGEGSQFVCHFVFYYLTEFDQLICSSSWRSNDETNPFRGYDLTWQIINCTWKASIKLAIWLGKIAILSFFLWVFVFEMVNFAKSAVRCPALALDKRCLGSSIFTSQEWTTPHYQHCSDVLGRTVRSCHNRKTSPLLYMTYYLISPTSSRTAGWLLVQIWVNWFATCS